MEPAWLICVPVAEMEVEPAEGSVERPCAECGTPVWVAQSSQPMLDSGNLYRVMCTNCAIELEKEQALHLDLEPDPERKRQEILERIAQLKTKSEAAYDKMYDLSEDREIRWEFEIAYDGLHEAARLARELGLVGEAEAHDQRAAHIRKVYRHQFMYPPDLSA